MTINGANHVSVIAGADRHHGRGAWLTVTWQLALVVLMAAALGLSCNQVRTTASHRQLVAGSATDHGIRRQPGGLVGGRGRDVLCPFSGFSRCPPTGALRRRPYSRCLEPALGGGRHKVCGNLAGFPRGNNVCHLLRRGRLRLEQRTGDGYTRTWVHRSAGTGERMDPLE
jgi:hypothetical protein